LENAGGEEEAICFRTLRGNLAFCALNCMFANNF
jgi:hypothetical protein